MSTAVTAALTPQQQFEENIKDRLRKDVGSLLPDDVLAKLVEKSVQEIFFTRTVEKDRYGYVQKDEPSWFTKEVDRQLKGSIAAALTNYFEQNKEAISKLVVEHIVAKTPQVLASIIVGAFLAKSHDMIQQSMTTSLEEKLRDILK